MVDPFDETWGNLNLTYEAEMLCNIMQEQLAELPCAIIVNADDHANNLGTTRGGVLRRFSDGAREVTIADLAELAASAGYRFVTKLEKVHG